MILAVADQDRLVRRLHADENIAEIGLGQQVHHGGVVPEIGGNLGPETKRFPMALHPRDEFLENGLRVGPVADKVVVANKDFLSPPQVKEGFQLHHDLIGAFVTGLAAVKIDNVAELAIKRTSPGKRNRYIGTTVTPGPGKIAVSPRVN